VSKSADSYFEKALLASTNGKIYEALALHEEALKLNPQHTNAWAMRGLLEHRLGRNFNAVIHLERAVHTDPGRHDIWCNLGIIAAANGLHEQSEICLNRSLKLAESVEAHTNLGDLYIRLGKKEEAAEEFRRALKIRPGNSIATGNLGQTLKGLGEWKEGFRLLLERFKSEPNPPRALAKYPLWGGEDLAGKRILLFQDNGSGDEILAFRFASALAKRYPECAVILETRPEMYRIAKWLPHIEVRIQQDHPGLIDCAFACGDLPLYLDIDRNSIPDSAGYLGKCLFDVPRLDLPAGLKIGICWRTGKRPLMPWTDRLHKAKTMQLAQLEPLLQSGAIYVSLQLDAEEDLAEFNIIDGMCGVSDFYDTAGIIDQLDLVITVDTSVAHLAGAMGKPVWNFVTFDAVWPWMDEKDKTCWYDSMTIYRQPTMNSWDKPINDVAERLRHLLRANSIAA
jgi:tetratricopeptide (TPR) repeat protein